MKEIAIEKVTTEDITIEKITELSNITKWEFPAKKLPLKNLSLNKFL